jgi:hypothetical protein
MNFTKPGVTGGKGYKGQDLSQRILVKTQNGWENITNQDDNLEYVKTDVYRRKKDVIAAGQDSDQEDWVEDAFNTQGENMGNTSSSINANGPSESTF